MVLELVGAVTVWLLASLILIWVVQRLCVRRQLTVLAERLLIESRIDDVTRQSLQAMREAVRRRQW